ncbi:MAG TPA: CsbD family protein [Anaeromyxobacter sp.]
MNKDQIEGKIEEIKGDLKERIGGASKDRSTQAEGWMEEKKGKIRQGIGDVKEDLEKRRDEMERDVPERQP